MTDVEIIDRIAIVFNNLEHNDDTENANLLADLMKDIKQNTKMAGIDKTYIKGGEYPAYRQWWIDNYEKMIKELGTAIWLHPFSVFDYKTGITPSFLEKHTEDLKEYVDKSLFSIWNTTEKQDKWLIKNCSILSFQKRMREVYNPDWEGFKTKGSWTWVKDKYLEFHGFDEYRENMGIDIDFGYWLINEWKKINNIVD